MPRQARLDIPGLLHHVMARGIGEKGTGYFSQQELVETDSAVGKSWYNLQKLIRSAAHQQPVGVVISRATDTELKCLKSRHSSYLSRT